MPICVNNRNAFAIDVGLLGRWAPSILPRADPTQAGEFKAIARHPVDVTDAAAPNGLPACSIRDAIVSWTKCAVDFSSSGFCSTW